MPGIAEGDDLAVRAARLLQAEGGARAGVEIELEKNIPIGGGLGGGSSDCATTLAVLNRLWGLDLPKERARRAGARARGGCSVLSFRRKCLRRGDRRAPRRRSDCPQAWYVVLVPPVAVSTRAIFAVA